MVQGRYESLQISSGVWGMSFNWRILRWKRNVVDDMSMPEYRLRFAQLFCVMLYKCACCASSSKEKKLAFYVHRSIQFISVPTCFLRKTKKYTICQSVDQKSTQFLSQKTIQFFRLENAHFFIQFPRVRSKILDGRTNKLTNQNYIKDVSRSTPCEQS
jgi:hypothetical protein